ncbi:MAG: hypothetical protein AB1Z57_00065 [Acidimicrobiia bacterium]
MFRRLGPASLPAIAVLAESGTAFGHGIGAASEPPVPLGPAIAVATALLVGLAMALGARRREPRLEAPVAARPFGPGGLLAVGERVGRTLGAVGLVVVAAGTVIRAGDGIGLAPVLVWVVWWLVLPMTSLVAGNVHRLVGPWWWVDRFGRPAPVRDLGLWPAVVALWVVVWAQLVWPLVEPTMPIDTATFLGIGALALTAHLVVAARFGVPVALADPVAVNVRLFSAIAPFGAVDGRPARRRWLTAVPALPRWPGLAAFGVVGIGTVAYDGLASTRWWRDTFPDLWDTGWFATVALAAVPAALGLLWTLTAWGAARAGGRRVAETSTLFAHVLVPVLAAWFVSHHLTLALFEVQLLATAIVDPFARAGGADATGIVVWLGPTTVWWLLVGAVVAGHAAAIVLIHDRAVTRLGASRALPAEYAMLVFVLVLNALALVVVHAA